MTTAIAHDRPLRPELRAYVFALALTEIQSDTPDMPNLSKVAADLEWMHDHPLAWSPAREPKYTQTSILWILGPVRRVLAGTATPEITLHVSEMLKTLLKSAM